ncbi:hypothetical protein B0T10DRAFT_465317 [Thelonectria olida]|uniref:Xylanolytic transcriptional activator regulatory domain-containing protein n=1 Tax=Thelonectria olida TaxID=1576542 RepID=A0A9P8VTU4_9HYPO|nr:hypothetical protein B0T10DRAFT_465317 [Thelonectria olida]
MTESIVDFFVSKCQLCDQRSPTCSQCGIAALLCTYDIPRRKRGPKPRDRSYGIDISLDVGDDQGEAETPDLDDCQPQVVSDSLRSPPHRVNPVVGLESGIVVTQPMTHHKELLSSMAKKGLTPDESVEHCISLYIEFVFPLIPILCESTLRSQASLMLPPFIRETGSPLLPLTPDMVHSVRTYSLTASLCAFIAHIRPCEDHPRDDTLAALFLASSQAMLHPYSGYDISYPNSTSLSIRIFQSSCYHMMGNSCLAWHVMGEAVRLAQQMRLYNERSYHGMDPIEAKMCRNAFWYLCSADRSASLLPERTLSLQGPYTAAFCQSETPPLLDPSRPENYGQFEGRLLMGVWKDHQVWKLGVDVLADLDIFLAASSRTGNGTEITLTQQRSLREAYLRFIGVLDDLPDDLTLNAAVHDLKDERERYQRRAFWIQKMNITLTYHYLRMSILNRFISAKIPQVLGLHDDPTSIACRKVEIAHELLNSVTSLPLESLQANGEPCNMKWPKWLKEPRRTSSCY